MKYQKYSLIYLSSFLLTTYFGLFHSRISHAGLESQIGKQIGRQGARFVTNPSMAVGIVLGLLVISFIGTLIYNQVNK